jgi:hypothetical protein
MFNAAKLLVIFLTCHFIGVIGLLLSSSPVNIYLKVCSTYHACISPSKAIKELLFPVDIEVTSELASVS